MNKNAWMWTGLGLAFVLVLCVGASAVAYGYESAYRDKIFGGVSVAGLRLDGLTRDQARQALQTKVDRSLEPGFRFTYGQDTIDLPRTTQGVEDPDLSQDLIRYDVDSAVSTAFGVGRGNGLVSDSLNRLGLLLNRRDLPLVPQLNKPLIAKLLSDEVDKHSSLPRDADISVRYASGTNSLETSIVEEQQGRTGDVTRALDTLEAQAAHLAFQPIPIQATVINPMITSDTVRGLLDGVSGLLGSGRITLTIDKKKYDVATSTIAGWVHASATDQGAVLAFDPARVAESLKPIVKDQLIEPKSGSLTLDAGGQLKDFVAPMEGIVVDGAKTGSDVEDALAHGSSTAPLTVVHLTPDITGPDAERLGVTHLLGVGKSNFAGSPTNRRKNIALGAKKMNGVLIAPGDTFSQLKVLGPVDGDHGWFQELVIKGDKTTPEYGGGLCQIGTTSFRAALASGLPIVERQNHSYRVVYYEPAGTDATIYDPAPDFKFKNDTPGNLLITSQIEGDNLLFFVWGTPDGRAASSTTPKVYDIVPPPPKKIIPTTDLPVGQTKCTEIAHAGATASFDYAVAYADGTYKKETFTSHYRPWGAVCLVGATPEEVEAAPAPAVDETGVNNPN
ncbi:MAG TPA: VanW family protein [Verrucomicrobiae bacterium]|nr:VanW family protein [Verrucomicrobiae bacterium]